MIVIREVEVQYKSTESVVKSAAYVDSPQKVFEFLNPKIGNQLKENFVALFLDNKNKIIGWETISTGTLSVSIVHPRETFRAAVIVGAASVVVAHNHPSGSVEPSSDDINTTRRLRESGEILGIPVRDHVIIGDNCYYSFKEQGQI